MSEVAEELDEFERLFMAATGPEPRASHVAALANWIDDHGGNQAFMARLLATARQSEVRAAQIERLWIKLDRATSPHDGEMARELREAEARATPCGCSCHGTKKSELGTVTHDQARRAAASMLHPPSYQTLIDYISQNRERDAKLEEAYAQLRARHTRIAELEGVQRDIMAQRNAVTAQRDALLAALVKHLPLLDGLFRSLPEGPIRNVVALWLADLDAAIKGAGEPEECCAEFATGSGEHGDECEGATPPSDKRDGRIERLRAAIVCALVHQPDLRTVKILNEALAADDAEAQS
jgi:hypothetical protein